MEEETMLCQKCNISFKARRYLNEHVKKYHPELETVVGTKSQICGLCDGNFRTIALLQKHLEIQHLVIMKYVNETFYSQDDFVQWKRKIEKESQASFIFRNSSDKKEGKKLSYYVCHRSGFFKPKEERTRHIKVSGSVKSNCTCPAIMNVTSQTVEGATEINVRYQSVHVGHEMETGKLALPKDDRKLLATKLDKGIPMTRILDETRQKYNPTSRLSLTTRKDLHNVVRDFQLKRETVLHHDDATSVELLVKKMSQEENNPVIIYKPVGQLMPNYPDIQERDFLLGFMNDAQEKLLDLHGSSCIMIDSTHGTNQYGFELTTLMIHDPNHEGLPVATLFSSRTGSDLLIPFFDAIKNRIPNFKTGILMTDDTNSFLNAWEKVFEQKPLHLLCIWHVNKNINRNIQIKVKSNKPAIKREINELLTETDIATFQDLTDKFVNKYKEEESSFIHYFQVTYLNRAEKWAYCHRKGLGINTNMKLERWHRQIKHEESGGTIMKRLDASIAIIMNAVAKKLLGRIISLERGKLTHRVALIRKRHNKSLEMGQEYGFIELENGYCVTKTDGSSIYSYNVERCNPTSICCTITCDTCKICIHTMSCTCADYSVKFIICKHIHYVCQKLNDCEPGRIVENSDDDDEMVVDINEQKEKQAAEKEIIVSVLRNEEFSNKKIQVIMKLKELTRTIQSWDETLPFPDLMENIKAMEARIEMSKASTILPKEISLGVASKEPNNKRIAKQRKFAVKKKRAN